MCADRYFATSLACAILAARSSGDSSSNDMLQAVGHRLSGHSTIVSEWVSEWVCVCVCVCVCEWVVSGWWGTQPLRPKFQPKNTAAFSPPLSCSLFTSY
jgi:hypothetical protein